MVGLKEFLDNTDETELQLYTENIMYADKVERECTRQITYYNLLPNMKKGFKKSIEQVFPLITDENNIYELEQTFDESDYEDTKAKLDKIKDNINIEEILKKNE